MISMKNDEQMYLLCAAPTWGKSGHYTCSLLPSGESCFNCDECKKTYESELELKLHMAYV